MGRLISVAKSLMLVLASVIFTLLLIEGLLRFLPIRSGYEVAPVNAGHPFINFLPNQNFTFSDGGMLTHVNHGHINGAGFVNDQEYDPGEPRPLLAVIGDSYVEALIIPYPATLQGRLSRAAGNDRRVYSFAASGTSLLDYLFYADYAARIFGARRFVVNVVGNDFDEMLLSPVLIDYRPGWGRVMTHHSALFRYLWHNVGTTPFGFRAKATLANLLSGSTGQDVSPAAAGNTAATAEAERIELSKRAVRTVLTDFPLRAGQPPANILFLVDSVRVFDQPALTEAGVSYFGVMRRYFIKEARRRGFEVRDLQEAFARRHARDATVFQYPDDGHWNPDGHEEAANAVMDSRLWRDFLAAQAERSGNASR